MEWLRKSTLATRLRSFSKSRNSYLTFDSRLRIPIIVNTIHVTQASTQTRSMHCNNNAEGSVQKSRRRRRKYQHRFNKCLAELQEKYPPIPAHEYLKNDSKKTSYASISNDEEISSCIWSKLLESREDLSKLNQTLEDLDQRLENLSFKYRSKDILLHSIHTSTDI